MKKKIVSLLLTLVLALSATTMTAFAVQVPDWYDDVITEVSACVGELEREGGFSFTSDIAMISGSFRTLCDSLDAPVFNFDGNIYSIVGDRGPVTDYIDIIFDEDGDLFCVRYAEYLGADALIDNVYYRNHDTSMVPMKAPTMDEDGCKLYYECTCGMYFEDSAATVKIADIDAWKTTEGKGLIHMLSYVPAPEEKEEAEKEDAKKDDAKKSPATGATTLGLGSLGLGIAILTALKKKED